MLLLVCVLPGARIPADCSEEKGLKMCADRHDSKTSLSKNILEMKVSISEAFDV